MTFSLSGSATTPARRLSDQPSDAKALPPVQDVVGERLRAVYCEMMREPIPQRILDLLERLDSGTGDRA